jgi:epoxyqueuosine reductase
MERRLRRVHRRFRQVLGIEVTARIYVDTGPVLERELAQRAGLGWFGRNTMLIHPRRGSYFFLGALLLGVDLEPDEPFARDHCGTCRACLDACPTGALLGRDASGAPIMDARLCISYLTIENRGPIPHDLRPPIGNRIFGCDICQEVCPFNESFAEDTNEPGYAARGPGERPAGVEALPEEDPSAETHPGTEAPSLVELLETALNEDAWEAFSRGSALRRAGRAGFARNVCVGLGNWRSEKAVPTLASALRDPEPLVRGHAAWALGRIGSATAREELSARRRLEGEESVRREIASALS